MGGEISKISKEQKEQLKKIEELLHIQLPQAVSDTLLEKPLADLNTIATILGKMHPGIVARIANNPFNLVNFSLETLAKFAEITPEQIDKINNSTQIYIKAYHDFVMNNDVMRLDKYGFSSAQLYTDAYMYFVKRLDKDSFTERTFELRLKFASDFRNHGDTSLSEESKIQRTAMFLMRLGEKCYQIGVENNFDRLYMDAANKAYDAVPKESAIYATAQKSKYLGFNPLFRLATYDFNEQKFYTECFETLECREANLNAEDEYGYTAAHRLFNKYKSLSPNKIFYKAFLLKLLTLPHQQRAIPNDKMRREEANLLNEIEKELADSATRESMANVVHPELSAAFEESDGEDDIEPGANAPKDTSTGSGSFGTSNASAAANATVIANPVGISAVTAAAATKTSIPTVPTATATPAAASSHTTAKRLTMMPYSSGARRVSIKAPNSSLFELARQAKTLKDLDIKILSEHLESAEGGQKSNLDAKDPSTGLTAAETLYRRYCELMSPQDKSYQRDQDFFCYLISKGATCNPKFHYNFGHSMGTHANNTAAYDVKTHSESHRLAGESAPLAFTQPRRSFSQESRTVVPAYAAYRSRSSKLYLTEEAARNPVLHLATQKTLKVDAFFNCLLKPENASALILKFKSKTLCATDFNPNMLKPSINLNEVYKGKTTARYLFGRFKDIFRSKINISTDSNLTDLFKNILIALGADPKQSWVDACPLLKLPDSAHSTVNRLTATVRPQS